MIRLRIERTESSHDTGDGLLWFEDGHFVGRVIIEEWSSVLPNNECGWVPVEVIDAAEKD